MKKHQYIEYLTAWLLLMVFGLIVIHAPLTVIIGNNFPHLSDIVKAWKEIFMLLALLLTVVAATKRKKWSIFMFDKLIWLIVGYAVLNLVYLAFSPSIASIVGLAVNLRYLAFFLLVFVFLRLYPKYRTSFIKVAVVGALVVIGFTVIQMFLPSDALKHLGYSSSTIRPYTLVDDNPGLVRFNSTLRGPNPLGAYAVIVIAGVLSVFINHRKSIRERNAKIILAFLSVGALVALWFSYSRSALLGALVAIAIILALKFGQKISKTGWLMVVSAVLVAGSLLFVFRDSSFVHNVILHDNPTTGASIDSNSEHMNSFVNAAKFVLVHPIGDGLGSTGSASLYGPDPTIVENQYLMVGHELGWLGMTVYVVIFVVVMARLWSWRSDWLALAVFASGIGLAIIGLLLPVWADDTVSIVWWGLSAIALTKGELRGKKTNKKTARTT